MIKLIGDELWQWDTGRQVKVTAHANEIHFGNVLDEDALVVPVVDGVADIPNLLLQSSLDVIAWCVLASDDYSETKFRVAFDVNPRLKPSDYVYTETEVKNYATLEKRIDEVEKNSNISDERIATAVQGYLEENPPQLITVDSELSLESVNPVQNKVVTQSFKQVETTIGNIDVLLGTI